MSQLRFAIAGCTGKVGRMFITVLEEKKLPISNIIMFASKKSAGTKIQFNGKDYAVLELNKENVVNNPVDFVLMSTNGENSKEFAPIFASTGAIVIDNSSQWRMDANTPLVVPQVNPQDAFKNKGIIANPNCSTIQAVVALKPLDDAFKIKRVIYSTYQAVSGAGVAGCEDLENGMKGIPPKKFAFPIFNNVIPQIDVFLENGYAKEEQKMIDETKKILGNYDLQVTATTVRVPVLNGHSISINVEFFNDAPIDKVKKVLSDAPAIVLMDDIKNNIFPMPFHADGKDEVFVGRVRKDFSIDRAINLWVVADNTRKGAATNAVEIAELLIN